MFTEYRYFSRGMVTKHIKIEISCNNDVVKDH